MTYDQEKNKCMICWGKNASIISLYVAKREGLTKIKEFFKK